MTSPRLARIGNLIPPAVNTVVTNAGFAPYVRLGFTKVHPILAESFVSAYFAGWRSRPDARPQAVFGFDMGRPVTDNLAVVDGHCSPASYYGDIVACADPIPNPIDENCAAVTDPDAPWVVAPSTAAIHTAIVAEIEAVHDGLRAQLCTDIAACLQRGCQGYPEWLYEASVALESPRFEGFRWRIAITA